jgi:alkanesulfonate monooxygenase SsuD/methylene tetrahydromethanopterin reductase-like flavin-dependent oxidoreductase (luciferase family)
MRFGVAVPNFRPLGTRDALVETAQQAEALGYDSIWSTDVVVQTPGAATWLTRPGPRGSDGAV